MIERLNVNVSGNPAGPALLFAHGFGCDQRMWRDVVPEFEHDHRVVLFDHIGCGQSDDSAFDAAVYTGLDAYATDVLTIIDDLALEDVVIIGHSVSAMIGVLAANRRPESVRALVLVGPSPRYIDDDDYRGGFGRDEIDELLESLDSNYLGWARAMAPVIMDNADRPALSAELTDSFCRMDPAIARQFARVTFLADNRADLADVTAPTLVLQCARDAIAPVRVGQFVHERIADSELVILDVSGHCPNLSAPGPTAEAIRRFVDRLPDPR